MALHVNPKSERGKLISTTTTPIQPSLPHWPKRVGVGGKEKWWESDTATEWRMSPQNGFSHPVIHTWFPSNHLTQSCRQLAISSRDALEKVLTRLPKYLQSQVDMGWKRQSQQLRVLVKSPVTSPLIVINPGILHHPLLDSLNSV